MNPRRRGVRSPNSLASHAHGKMGGGHGAMGKLPIMGAMRDVEQSKTDTEV